MSIIGRKMLQNLLLFSIISMVFIGFADQAEAQSGFIEAAAMESIQGQGGEIRFFGLQDMLQMALSIIFYIVMLALTGWLVWMRWLGTGYSESFRGFLKKGAVVLQQAYTVVYILFMGAALGGLIRSGGSESLIGLFNEAPAGYAWAGGLLLALLSFVWLYRSAWMDYAWVAVVWFGKSLLSHAASFEPKGAVLALEWVHLGAASVWTGGLIMLLALVFRKNRPDETRMLLPLFSKASLFCMLLLIASGTLSVFLFLPEIDYVLETNWGRWLLAKCALVLLAAVVAVWMHAAFRRKSGELSAGSLLAADAVLTGCIVIMVGIFTYWSPLPANKPLYYHVMGEKMHMTAQIGPKTPGVNDFTLKVWLPEPLGAPKRVDMKLQEKNSPDMAAVEIPLVRVEDRSADENFGMPRYTYRANGAYLPKRGDWKLEVRVIDRNDEETVYHHEFKVY